jgi:hypothetical protein
MLSYHHRTVLKLMVYYQELLQCCLLTLPLTTPVLRFPALFQTFILLKNSISAFFSSVCLRKCCVIKITLHTLRRLLSKGRLFFRLCALNTNCRAPIGWRLRHQMAPYYWLDDACLVAFNSYITYLNSVMLH